MPSIRIGFSTDFNLTGEQVGIGTTFPTARLDVRGQILSDNSAGSGGVSTITRYDGFLNKEQRLADNVSIGQTTKGNLNSISGEIVIPSGKEITVSSGTPIAAGRLDSLTVTNAFDLPHGGTLEREETPEKGSTRFNQDLGQLEFYTGTEWRTTLSYDGSGRGRGFFAGVETPGPASLRLGIIQYITISTLGNAIYFGDLSVTRSTSSSAGSSTRMLWGGGYSNPGTPNSTIDYITVASSGNAISFGSLSGNKTSHGSVSSSTRGIWAGGYTPGIPSASNVIDYVQIDTLGSALDFGDLARGAAQIDGVSSPTRGVFTEQQIAPDTTTFANMPRMTFITIASKGDSVAFGELSQGRRDLTSCSNTIRGLFASGASVQPTNSNTIDYITIATLGNAIDFGDLTDGRRSGGGCSNSTRGIFGGGSGSVLNSPAGTNVIDYVTITSAGNAQDFGDLSTSGGRVGGGSDSHGGLGGF